MIKLTLAKCGILLIPHFLFIIGKNIIGDLMNNFELSVDLARQTIECGGEVSRAEETVRRLNNYDCNVFATTSLIVAQKGEKTAIRRIYKDKIDLAMLARINSLSRSLANESTAIKNYTAYESKAAETISNFFAAFFFSLFFGGMLIDAVFSGIIAVIISIAQFNKIEFNLFSKI